VHGFSCPFAGMTRIRFKGFSRYPSLGSANSQLLDQSSPRNTANVGARTGQSNRIRSQKGATLAHARIARSRNRRGAPSAERVFTPELGVTRVRHLMVAEVGYIRLRLRGRMRGTFSAYRYRIRSGRWACTTRGHAPPRHRATNQISRCRRGSWERGARWRAARPRGSRRAARSSAARPPWSRRGPGYRGRSRPR
jgi:hypothetical protein